MNIWGGLLVGALGLSLAVALGLYWRARKESRRAADAIERLAQGAPAVQGPSQPDAGSLDGAIGRLAASLDRVREDSAARIKALEARVSEQAEELQRTRQAALDRERLAAVGALAGGIAHEFNNILCAVRGQIDLAALNPTPERVKRAAESAAACSERTSRITEALLTFARHHAPSVRPTDVRHVVQMALALYRTDLATHNIALSTKFSEVEMIGAEPDRLLQVFANIVAHARDAMRHNGGRLSVLIRAIDQWVEIAFRDSAPAPTPDQLAHLFEPFYAESVTDGPERLALAGPGLSVAREIVQSHGGEIVAESGEGGGTVIRVRLPVRPWPAKQTRPRGRPATSAQSRRILIVEDEPDILAALSEMLTLRGWSVETAANGTDATDKISQGSFPYHLIDVAIPGINGLQLARMVRGRSPDTRLVIVSGYSTEEVAVELADQDVAAYISKPFRCEDLVETLEGLVTSSTRPESPISPR